MFRKLIDKFMYHIYKWSSDYVYRNFYIPKHADKDFWGDEF